MPIRGEGLVEASSSSSRPDEEQDGTLVYVLHPNCAVEEM